MTVSSQVGCNRNCPGEAKRDFSTPALLEVSRLRKARLFLPIESVCVNCGTILAPTAYADGKHTVNTDHAGLALRNDRVASAKVNVADIIGKNGNYLALGLPSWDVLPGHLPSLPAGSRDTKLQHQEAKQRSGALAHALGLVDDVQEHYVDTPVVGVTVNQNAVAHLVKNNDAGHNELVKVAIATLRFPREIWEDLNEAKLRFFGRYSIGGIEIATHLAVVALDGAFLYSVYEIDDAGNRKSQGATRDSITDRTNRKRQGTCRYLAY